MQQAMGNSHAMELEAQWNDLFLLMLAFSVFIILKFSNHMTCFSTAKKNIQGIKFIFITKHELTKTQESSEDRFPKAIPGTRSYHEFISLSENSIAMKYCSKDQEVATTFSFSMKIKPVML